MSPTNVLSFDTSLNSVQVSLMQGEQVVAEAKVEPSGADRQEVAALLLPEIDRAIKGAQWQKSEIGLIVVGTGPGSFTGIRVAAITGRTLSQALKVPLIGVSVLESRSADLPKPAAIILGAGGGNYFFGAYEKTASDPSQVLLVPAYAGLEAMKVQLAGIECWYADEKAFAEVSRIQDCQILPVTENLATAASKLALSRLFLSGAYSGDRFTCDPLETFAWWKVLPLYLRSPSVTIKKSYGNTHQAHDSRRSR